MFITMVAAALALCRHVPLPNTRALLSGITSPYKNILQHPLEVSGPLKRSRARTDVWEPPDGRTGVCLALREQRGRRGDRVLTCGLFRWDGGSRLLAFARAFQRPEVSQRRPEVVFLSSGCPRAQLKLGGPFLRKRETRTRVPSRKCLREFCHRPASPPAGNVS